ncbi:MAG: tRNA (guanosine(37)-N1)-methyltransferase TrmD [SAR202 cluster bacterium]|jgi:tRNA (guanine37-N1)-methyltransferase|nr:tRNA (guanosine(37)-N1)-methyltransferase TrmD [SAR202 cluster bacterium]|tara:strand:+ start:4534 stop:5286 length:753 start_codon:yes stop_codon:yes gene_type:complete
MRFHVLTLFPGMFEGPMSESIIARAQSQGLIEVSLHDIRDHAHDKHRQVDDYGFGGGPGMVMKPAPIFEAVEHVKSASSLPDATPVILLSPQGDRLDQSSVERLATFQDLVLICGRYEGVDERVRQHLATEEISIGDYVLGGGELAAMVVIDAVARLVPGVVGSTESPANDSFTTGLLQHPLYTRPAEFRNWEVPEMLLSGNHAEIDRWRRHEALRRTLAHRPDLLERLSDDLLTEEDRRYLDELSREHK